MASLFTAAAPPSVILSPCTELGMSTELGIQMYFTFLGEAAALQCWVALQHAQFRAAHRFCSLGMKHIWQHVLEVIRPNETTRHSMRACNDCPQR